jgi:hypothetical protein
MIKFLLLCWLMMFQWQEEFKPLVEHKTPLADRVTFTLSSDRTVYYVFEPLQLTMTFRNEGDNELTGVFWPELGINNLTIYYRRQGGEFEMYACSRQERPRHVSIFLPQRLKPHED